MRRSIVGMAVLSIAAFSPLAKADQRQDQQIANQVQQGLLELKDQGALRGFSIDLQVEDATVWLKGRVSSADHETNALEMARHIPGVKQVVDDLHVATPAVAAPKPVETKPQAPAAKPATEPSQMPNVLGSLRRIGKSLTPKTDRQVRPVSEESSKAKDNSLAREIVNRLQVEKDSGALQGFNIDLQVENGDVLLNGYVKDSAQHAKVIDVTRRVPGVRQVVDGLSVAQNRPVTQVSNLHPVPAQQPYYASPQQQYAAAQYAQYAQRVNYQNVNPMPMAAGGPMVAPARFDHPQLPGYAWPSYAAHPNYAAVSYPKQYSPAAWPYIGPFHPYPQVPLGWRKVTLQWDDGWWFLDFKDK